jgi:hypothetical protein
VYLGKVLVAELERGVEVLAEEVWVAGAVGLGGEGVHHHQVTLVTRTLFTHHTPHCTHPASFLTLHRGTVHCKKRLAVFPSPAVMSLRLGTGKPLTFFYSVA